MGRSSRGYAVVLTTPSSRPLARARFARAVILLYVACARCVDSAVAAFVPSDVETVSIRTVAMRYCVALGGARSPARPRAHDTLAEWSRRRPAKPMGSPRVGSNPTGVVVCARVCTNRVSRAQPTRDAPRCTRAYIFQRSCSAAFFVLDDASRSIQAACRQALSAPALRPALRPSRGKSHPHAPRYTRPRRFFRFPPGGNWCAGAVWVQCGASAPLRL